MYVKAAPNPVLLAVTATNLPCSTAPHNGSIICPAYATAAKFKNMMYQWGSTRHPVSTVQMCICGGPICAGVIARCEYLDCI